MSDIKKGERADSKLKAQHQAYRVREMITAELMAITRERRKLKAYKRLLDAGRMEYEEVENAFKGWLGGNWKMMSHQQIYSMNELYKELFGRSISWQKNHSRLSWLMAHPSKTSA